MVKAFTVMYILYSLYTSTPDMPQAAFTQNIEAVMVHPDAPSDRENGKDTEPAASEEKKIDYIEELKKLGYYKDEFSDKKLVLRNAIIRFESDHNLEVKGEWNDKNLSILKKRLGEPAFNYPDSVSESPAADRWIAINKTKRILTVYEDKTVVKKYPVAVGNPPSLTPSGKFTIVNKAKNPAWGGGGYAKPVSGGSPKNPLGFRWMGISYKGGSRYGIHGNNSPYSIGKIVSHGCIRMINPDVEALYEIIPVSTHVWLGTDEELRDWGVIQDEYKVEESE